MLRVCCHGGRLPDSVRAVCVQTGVPLCGVHSPHNACESSSQPTADRDPILRRRVLARPVLPRQHSGQYAVENPTKLEREGMQCQDRIPEGCDNGRKAHATALGGDRVGHVGFGCAS